MLEAEDSCGWAKHALHFRGKWCCLCMSSCVVYNEKYVLWMKEMTVDYFLDLCIWHRPKFVVSSMMAYTFKQGVGNMERYASVFPTKCSCTLHKVGDSSKCKFLYEMGVVAYRYNSTLLLSRNYVFLIEIWGSPFEMRVNIVLVARVVTWII